MLTKTDAFLNFPLLDNNDRGKLALPIFRNRSRLRAMARIFKQTKISEYKSILKLT